MKNWFEMIVSCLLSVWKKEMNIPLPRKWRDFSGDCGDWECAAFPLLGWLLGAVIALAGALTAWIFNVYAGALVFALLGWLLFVFRDSGRSEKVFSAWAAEILPGGNIPWQVVVPAGLMLGRLALLLLLFLRGEMWYLPIIVGGMFMMEAMLTLDGCFNPPLLDDSPEARFNMNVTAAVLALISFAFVPLATALGVVVFIMVWRAAQHKSEQHGTDMLQITLAGSGAGWALLLAGVLAI